MEPNHAYPIYMQCEFEMQQFSTKNSDFYIVSQNGYQKINMIESLNIPRSESGKMSRISCETVDMINQIPYKQNAFPEKADPFSQQEKWYKYNIQSNNLKFIPDYNDVSQYVNHIIQLDDTIEGLAIQYGVSAQAIRKFNNINTNDIFQFQNINIPDPKQNIEKQQPIQNIEELKRQMKLQQFYEKILSDADKSIKFATAFLELYDWDLRLAISEYQKDDTNKSKRKFFK